MKRIAGEPGCDQGNKNRFGLEAVVEPRSLQVLGELGAEAFGFGEHADEATLGGLGGTADEFGLKLDFAAALFGGFAERRAEDRLVDAQLLSDAGGPFGTEDAVGDSLHVGQKKIYRAAFAFASSEIHMAGT